MTVRVKATGRKGIAFPREDGTVRVVLDHLPGCNRSFFDTEEVSCVAAELETLRIICPCCGHATLRPGMYSEDGAAVFDQKCPACGVRHYKYIGERSGKDVWDEFEREFVKTWIPFA
jgi:hypothetical protein